MTTPRVTELLPAKKCGFCYGKPVLNAATIHNLSAPRYAPCPRCGETAETR